MATFETFTESAHPTPNGLLQRLRWFLDLPSQITEGRRTQIQAEKLRRSLDHLDSFQLDDIGLERVARSTTHWSLRRPAPQWDYRWQQAAAQDAEDRP